MTCDFSVLLNLNQEGDDGMRTVQEILKNMDEEKLINAYLYRFPINVQDCNGNEAKIGEVKATIHKGMHKYLERLRNLPIMKDNDQGIFFVHRCIEDDMNGQTFQLIFLNELKENREATESYGCDFIEQAKIMGYWVAETPLTKYYLEDLIVDILYEASFFGPSQEHLQEEKDKLNQMIADDDSETISAEDFFAELEEKQGYKFDHQSPDERELEIKVIKMAGEYWEHSRKKELRNVMKLLGI